MASQENVLCESAVCGGGRGGWGGGKGTKHVCGCSDVVCQREQIPPLKWKVNR